MLMDLNINIPVHKLSNKIKTVNWDPVLETILEAKRLGYQAVAVNQVIEGKIPQDVLKIWDDFPKREGITLSWENKDDAQKFGTSKFRKPGSFTVLRRISIRVSDPSQNYGINNSNVILNAYDIVSLIPENEKTFISASNGSFEGIDIISIDMESRLPYFLKLKTVRQAINTCGYFFELSYSASVKESSSIRRQWISNACSLIRATVMSGGKGSGGILITSGAECGFDLRSPYDVTNLVTFTGLNAALVKQCISEIPRLVLLHSDNRRYYQKSTAMAVLTNEKKRANFDTVSGRDNGDGDSNKKPKVTT